MALWQGGSTRKPTGGRRKDARGKRRSEIARARIDTHLGAAKQKMLRTKGGNQKIRLLAADAINVTDPKTGKTLKAAIKTVAENPANIHYVRRNIITRGAVVETDAGMVRVTSRPGQHGALSGVKL